MRDILAHQYADRDQEILLNTIDNRLDGFVDLVERLRTAARTRQTGEGRAAATTPKV